MTDIIIAFLFGAFIGTNFGFLVAGLIWTVHSASSALTGATRKNQHFA